MKDLQKAIGTPESGLRKQVVDLSVAGENRDEKIKTIFGRLDELESQLRDLLGRGEGRGMREMKKSRQGANRGLPSSPRQPRRTFTSKPSTTSRKGHIRMPWPSLRDFVQKSPDLTPRAQCLLLDGRELYEHEVL